MADYSAQATNLQSPQGAGAVVIQPVENRAVASPVFSALGDLTSMVLTGLKSKDKDLADERKRAIVGQYVKEQTALNDALSQGLPAAQAGARSRASASMYLASYPEYEKDFNSAQKTLMGITELGVAEEQVKSEKEFYKQNISRAQAAGYNIDPNSPKSTIDLQLNAFNATVRANEQMTQAYKASAEQRAISAEDRTVQNEELKRTSIGLINNIAGTRLEATGAVLTDIAGAVRAGTITQEQGKLKITQEFATIYATLQSAASTNPELAAPYRTLFDQLNKVGIDMLNPENVVKDQENQIKEIINKRKLIALADPKLATIVAASELMGANAQIALSAGNSITPIIAQMLDTAVGSSAHVPNIVGSGNEKDITGFLSKSIQGLNSGKFKDEVKAKSEITNGVNQVLSQAGEALNSGKVSAKELKDFAAFFAGPEYGSYATTGQLDKAAADAAKKTFQIKYDQVVIQGIQQKLEGFVYNAGIVSKGVKPTKAFTLSDAVDIKFTGSGVVFEQRPRTGDSPSATDGASSGVKDLISAQTALNQLIHIGAHLEGSTDYGKYWEEKKHVFLPQVFADPARLKPGDVVDGYKFLGGAYGDGRNWQPATK